ncbi:nucleotidyltransferase domain-containing protein [Streptomyces sp. NPDC046821]|uniref:nucleotidyltransferase domain-containing protein n=1 Tax=Streptomyces sp. NPDC046821 TaxID=3154702 RepID=UPI0033C1F4BA
MTATTTRGLDSHGYIAREGSLELIQREFAPVVAAAQDRLPTAFGPRLSSAYLYGSVPRGTARPGRSDLDLLIALTEEPTDDDRATTDALSATLNREFAQIDGVGVILLSRARVLSDLERHDLGWFVACLCTPLLGEDLAEHLPRYRPDPLLARETNGDLALILPRWRERVTRGDDPRVLDRMMSRHLVRTGFTLVMPRWQGWTSDLTLMAEVFGTYYPERADAMREAARAAYEPVGAPHTLRTYTEDLGPWLAAEYEAVHGVKAPRP